VRDKSRALELQRSTLERVVAQVSSSAYTVTTAAAAWVAAFCCAGLFFAQRRRGTVTGLLITSLLVCAIGVAGIYLWENGATGRALAIVTVKGTEARLATADNAGTVLALPPGSEIKVLSTRGNWLYADLPNNTRGWIPAQNAQRVRL
jgi:hypothetical protein